MLTRAGQIAAWVGALCLIGSVSALTYVQRGYLDEQGWSPVHRTPTEWPSLLATGPHGWVMSAAFVVAGLSVALVGSSIAAGAYEQWGDTRAKVIGGALLLAAVGLIGVAFQADPSTATSRSWHAQIHNLSYPAIPLGVLVAAVTAATCSVHTGSRTASRALVPVMVLSFAFTNVDAVAQAARYPAFLSLLVWLMVATSAPAPGSSNLS